MNKYNNQYVVELFHAASCTHSTLSSYDDAALYTSNNIDKQGLFGIADLSKIQILADHYELELSFMNVND